MSLQNCLNEERIAGVVGWGKTVGMVASLISVDMFEPARIRRTVAKGGDKHTVFRVGEVHGRITKRVEELRDMVGRIDSAKTTTNLWGERWSKLCQNGMKNGVSAATGLTGADCDRNDAIRRFSIKLGGEAVRVGQALGYHIEKIGKFEPETLAKAREGDKAALDEVEAILRPGSNTNPNPRADIQRPSMAQDIRKGRRTEIEFMNGYIADRGNYIGVPAPTHAKLDRDREEGRAQGSEGRAGAARRLTASRPRRLTSSAHGLKSMFVGLSGPVNESCRLSSAAAIFCK